MDKSVIRSMLIRMTSIASAIASLAAAGVLAAVGLLSPGAGHPAPRTALVVDAPAARHGRTLVDPRLRAIPADVRLPRSAAEARTDVRYFAAQGYDRVIVAGPRSTAAAGAADVAALRAADLTHALSAVRR
jgi:hypothetical protein